MFLDTLPGEASHRLVRVQHVRDVRFEQRISRRERNDKSIAISSEVRLSHGKRPSLSQRRKRRTQARLGSLKHADALEHHGITVFSKTSGNAPNQGLCDRNKHGINKEMMDGTNGHAIAQYIKQSRTEVRTPCSWPVVTNPQQQLKSSPGVKLALARFPYHLIGQ